MSPALPQWNLPPTPPGWLSTADPASRPWQSIPTLPPLVRADDGGPVEQPTVVRVCADTQALYVRFDCADRHIWGTYTQRDDPISDEEVVELFIAPGEANPTQYAEFEVSPNGVLFDGWVHNPTSQRADLVIETGWDCPGFHWQAGRDDAAGAWWVVMVVPWAALPPTGDRSRIWRANFYRIERPRDGEVEYSCWSPPLVRPVDFHKPACFGTLILET
jgi:hypothetical protein